MWGRSALLAATNSASPPAPVLLLDAGDTASYPGTGNLWYDLSGNGLNGTLAGSYSYASSPSGSISLSTAGAGYVSLPNLAPYLQNKSQFSISFLIRVTGAASAVPTLFTYYSSLAGDILIGCTSSILFVQVNNGADGSASCAFSLNSWYEITVVFDGTQGGNSNRLKVYINSNLQALDFGGYTVPATTVNASGSSAIGWYTYATPGETYIVGSISQFLLYAKPLSAEEVSTNFASVRGRFGI